MLQPLAEPRDAPRLETGPIRFAMTIVVEQETGAAFGEGQVLMIRALCHVLLQQLPARAFIELVPALLEMRRFYNEASRPTQLPASVTRKPLMRTVRTTRPGIELPEE
jgi:hypothetical protein